MQLLRTLIREVITASPEYMKKEKVREKMQGLITKQVRTGKIKDQLSLQNFLARLSADATSDQQLALTALRSIPFEVWVKLSRM